MKKKSRPQRAWTTDELQYLLEWHGKIPYKDIALALDRTYWGVRSYWNYYRTKMKKENEI